MNFTFVILKCPKQTKLENIVGLVYRSINRESKSVSMQEPNERKSNMLPNLISGCEEKD